MLDYPLVELVENVGSKGSEDVCIREILPERVNNGLDPCIPAGLGIYCTTIIKCIKRGKDVFKVA
jgi:hypothetical protein